MRTAFKKVIAAVCAGTVLLAGIGALAAQTAEQTEPASADILLAIGVIDNIQTLSEEVSRGEYMAFMANIFAGGEVSGRTVPPFVDVPETHTYYDAISWMYEQGYIVGNERRLFEPDRAITYGEALRVTIDMLGYGPHADISGGYPQGYLAQARSLKIMDGVNKTISATLTYEDVYNTMFHTLEAEPYYLIGGGNPEEDESTLLYRNFSVRRIEGVVTSDGVTSIDDNTVCMYGSIAIDGRIYQRSETDAFGDWLGYNVRAYVREGDDADSVVYIYPYKTAEMTLQANEILSVEDGTVRYSLEERREQKLELDPVINYIYNYKAEAIADYSEIIPESGYVSFIDNDNDGEYEIVKVFERVNMVLSYVDTEGSKLYDTDRGIALDLGGSETVYTITFDGQPLTLVELEQEDVLTLYQSRDGLYVNILVARESFEGTVTRVRSEDGATFVSVDGTEYKLSPDCNFIPDAGYKGDFMLNAYGEIIHIDRMFGEVEAFGYVLNVVTDDMNENTLIIKLFTTNGFIEKLSTAKRVTVNGVRTSDLEMMYNALCTTGEDGVRTVINQPMRYKTNKAGELYLIDTVAKVAGGEDDTFKLDKAKSTLIHKANGVFAGDFAVNADTSAILVPSDITDTEAFKMFNIANFSSDRSYVLEAYNFDETRIPEFVLVYENSNAQTRGIMYVDEVTVGLDDDEEAVAVLSGYVDGALQSVRAIDETLVNKLSRGDVIRYSLDGKGQAKEVEIWYDADTRTVGDAGGTITGSDFIAAGLVESVNGDIVLINTGKTDDAGNAIKYVYNMQGINIYKYNTDEDTLKLANWQEIKSTSKFGTAASRMFVYTYGGFTRSALIVE